MYKTKVVIDTMDDVKRFVELVKNVPSPVNLENGNLRVDGKSLLGILHAKEWKELWCTCEQDIYNLIRDYAR